MRLHRALATSAPALGLLAASAPPQDELWNGRDFAGSQAAWRLDLPIPPSRGVQ
ncbi:MAG TPA: hypothetical protein VG457_15265 [Planctomycetota bacterium]|jgi:hypothetical protein|nr:hypothetical protein [Planctomycetota bacterium]